MNYPPPPIKTKINEEKLAKEMYSRNNADWQCYTKYHQKFIGEVHI